MNNKPQIDPKKIVVFTGAGISVASGLSTFNDDTGMWHDVSVSSVATKLALETNPQGVISFWNERKKEMNDAQPSLAHLAIAKLEEKYDVTVITTNVDNLHEKAGSSKVMHLHGSINRARSSKCDDLIYDIEEKLIGIGELCEKNSQLRPDVVMYDENPYLIDEARQELKTAAKVLVIGSSLSVKPACNIFKAARGRAEKILVGFKVFKLPFGFRMIRNKADLAVPKIVERWLR